MQVTLRQIHDIQSSKHIEYEKVKAELSLQINNIIKQYYNKNTLYFDIIDSYTPHQLTLAFLGYIVEFKLVNNQIISSDDINLSNEVKETIKSIIIILDQYKELWRQSTIHQENGHHIKVLPDRIIINEQNVIYASPKLLATHRTNNQQVILPETILNDLLDIETSLINCPKWIQNQIASPDFIRLKTGINNSQNKNNTR